MKHYLMSPDIYGNKISFLWNDDLWLIEGSSSAIRLTNGIGIITNSRFSPDGRYIAFRVETGQDGSSADIYTISIVDGTVSRITYLGGKSTSRRMYTDVAGWTPSGQVVVSTDAYSPFVAATELYSVEPTGGPMTKLAYGPASNILYTETGVVIGRHTIDMPHWKKYKGGTSGVLWGSNGVGGFRKIVDMKHHISSPFYMNGRIYFVTDVDGTANLYSVDQYGKGMKKHTHFDKYYVRNAKSDGNRCVFQMAGEIYLYDPKSNRTDKIEPGLISSPHSPEQRYPDPSKYVEQFSLDHAGENISIVTRGRGFTTPFENGFVHEVGNSEERIKWATRINSRQLLYVSDMGGDENIYIFNINTLLTTKIAFAKGIVEWLTPDIKGEKILVSNNRGELYLLSVDGKGKEKMERIDRAEEGVITYPVWSRDGKLAAYSVPVKSSFGERPSAIIRIYSEVEKKTFDITEKGTNDFSPTFSQDGRFLYFLANRNLDPSADNFVFDLSFQVTKIPMIVPLDSVSSGMLDSLPIEQEEVDKKGKEIVRFAPQELKEKVRGVRLEPSNFARMAACADGVLLLEFPIEGMSRYGLFGGGVRIGRLIKYTPISNKEEVVSDGVADFEVSADGKVALIKDKDSNLIKMDIEHTERNRVSGSGGKKFDYKRLKLKVLPKEEWLQMFAETKRLVREKYWNEKKMEQKHKAAFTRYDNFLPSLSSRFELSDVLREFQGEFATSHSYEVGGDLTDKKAVAIGKLGMDLKFDRKGYIVKNMIKANLSNEGEKSPAFLASIPLREGDRIVSINLVPLDEKNTVERALLNRSEEYILLGVERNGKRIFSFMKTMADDKRLRYREWVERNREYVHRKTDDRVGYIHIPDMGYAGFSEFARLYPIESRKDALIVDVRNNGGGFVSQLLLEKLAKRRIGYDVPRRGEIRPYPSYTLNGPMVEIVDENAGSDGDIFTHSFKLFGLGPVIGTRTWGGVVGISPSHALVDGTVVTQPEFAFWFKDVGFGIENYGTDPTIEVQITPDDWREGRDSQLEKGIEVVLDLLEKYEGRIKPPS